MKKPFLIELNKIGSSSLGFISVAEESKLPFQIKRVYWTYFTPQDVIRGRHAHRKLKQIIFATSGIIRIVTETIDEEVKEFTLDKPNLGLFIGEMTWREIQFSHNAVLLSLASEEYTEEDYIRSYDDFKSHRLKKIEGLKVNLIEVSEYDAADIASFRSKPEINRFLSSQNPISEEEQAEWIRKNRQKNDNFYFKITNKSGDFKGTASLYNIKDGSAEFGRFISENPILAVEAEYLILKFAFENLHLKKVYCRTVEENVKVIQLHSRFGFKTTKIEDNQDIMRQLVVQEITEHDFLACNFKPILSLIEKI